MSWEPPCTLETELWVTEPRTPASVLRAADCRARCLSPVSPVTEPACEWGKDVHCRRPSSESATWDNQRNNFCNRSFENAGSLKVQMAVAAEWTEFLFGAQWTMLDRFSFSMFLLCGRILLPCSIGLVALCSLPIPPSVTAVHFLICSFLPVSLPKRAALVGQNPLCLGSQILEVIGNFHLWVGGGGRSGLGPKSLHF